MGDNRSSSPETRPPQAGLRVLLFDSEGEDRDLDEADIDIDALGEHQLLWVDLQDNEAGDADACLDRLVERLRLQDGRDALRALNGTPMLQNFGDWFLVAVNAVEGKGKLRFEGRGLAIVCGVRFVLSLHRGPLKILEELQGREHGETRLGSLRPESFTASLLDWQVDSYLHAVSDFEEAVDRLEVSLLSSRVHHECLSDLVQMRRCASRLRRILAPHRHVFGALARPDFRPDADGDGRDQGPNKAFRSLEKRFERALDAVETARDLVVGSFELFTSRSAQRTNATMRVLTFATVLSGMMAVIVGALGMNFTTPLFESGSTGFWITVALMVAIAVIAAAMARWKKWL